VLALGLVGLAAATSGARLLPDPPAPGAAYLVQAQVKMEEDWTQDSFQALLSDLVKGTIAAYARNESRSGLVVWPEMPAPLYADDRELRAHLRRLATATQSRMVVNAVAYADSERQRVYNSALLVDAAGEFRGRYDKIQLVPFGEYIPMKRLFFFMEKITTEVGDFQPGTVARPLGEPGPQPPLGALVCYENVFPDLVRKITAGGAAVLLNLSNDGWYGQSAARDQLLLMSRLRAVENGRWLLRATNTGITAVIDPYGRVRVFPPDRRAVYAARFGYRTERTVFVAFGHWFSALAAAAAVALVFRAWRANGIEERQP